MLILQENHCAGFHEIAFDWNTQSCICTLQSCWALLANYTVITLNYTLCPNLILTELHKCTYTQMCAMYSLCLPPSKFNIISCFHNTSLKYRYKYKFNAMEVILSALDLKLHIVFTLHWQHFVIFCLHWTFGCTMCMLCCLCLIRVYYKPQSPISVLPSWKLQFPFFII